MKSKFDMVREAIDDEIRAEKDTMNLLIPSERYLKTRKYTAGIIEGLQKAREIMA